jgi:hypothetical protein
MSVKGKKKDDWVAMTLVDCGSPYRRVEWRRHFSFAAAFRAYPKIWSIVHLLHGWAVWIEKRDPETGELVGGPLTR